MNYSFFALRCGLAAVFFWLGIDSLLHPGAWLVLVIPLWIVAVFELLIGLSLLTGVFMRLFGVVGIAVVITMAIIAGVHATTAPMIGLIGGLIAVILWSETNHN